MTKQYPSYFLKSNNLGLLHLYSSLSSSSHIYCTLVPFSFIPSGSHTPFVHSLCSVQFSQKNTETLLTFQDNKTSTKNNLKKLIFDIS